MLIYEFLIAQVVLFESYFGPIFLDVCMEGKDLKQSRKFSFLGFWVKIVIERKIFEFFGNGVGFILFIFLI